MITQPSWRNYDDYVRGTTAHLRCRRTRYGPIVVWVVDAGEDADPYLSEGFSPVVVAWGSETRARRRAQRRFAAHARRVRAARERARWEPRHD